MKLSANNFFIICIIIICLFFSRQFILQGKIPFPMDAVIGMNHPFRDLLAKDYPNGYPYKNYLITDAVRQQYPYRFLAFNIIKDKQLPVWNPYNFSGTPLLANIQSAVFYPFNFLFLFLNFNTAWSIEVLIQPLLACIFMFFYLKNLKLKLLSAFLGSICFGFSGFMTAWLEWNTIGHAVLWLPLILLAIDKIILKISSKWFVLLVFSLTMSFLAGHLQTTFYVWGFAIIYFIAHILIWIRKKNYLHNLNTSQTFPVIQSPDTHRGEESDTDLFKIIGSFTKFKMTLFLISCLLIIFLIYLFFSQLLPTINFISLSARNFDLPNWHRSDWFIPWQHSLQFIAPDFFGNPVTNNYWGVWNYGEFVGYIGLIPFIFAIFALIFRCDKKTFYFGLCLFICLFLALPTFIAKLPYQLNIPYFSTLQPSRILVLIDFCLSVLCALGFDYYLRFKAKEKSRFLLLFFCIVFILLFATIWISILFKNNFGFNQETVAGLGISLRNFILPTLLLFIFIIYFYLRKIIISKKLQKFADFLLLIIIIFDLLRFSGKYNTFIDKSLIYPETKTISFLKQNLGNFRYLSFDSRILPPNLATYYKIQSIDGYDPLYLLNYGQIVSSWTRNLPDITPAKFNRILLPQDYNSFLTNLFGVKYILSLSEIKSENLKLVFAEGETKIYENLKVFPRAYLVEEIISLPNQQKLINAIYKNQNKLNKIAFTDKEISIREFPLQKTENAQIIFYSENRIRIKVNTINERFLVLTDIYYPEWRVYINNFESTIIPVNYLFRGVFVPKGESIVEFKI